ncbi:MAG TPA: glycosyltransferase family 87 protein [Gemmataceae bacterium]|jgi:hypothetical protein|nr:glycosyltransferase family 87 protein [Gemmataceae bacterium]
MQLDPAPRSLLASKNWQRLAILCWFAVFAGLVVRLLVAHGLHSVYPIFSDAARCWQRGEDMYFPNHYVPGLDPYRYSPSVTMLFTPFAILHDRFGSIVWLSLNAALIVGGLLWWLRSALPRSLGPSQVALASMLVLSFAAGNLHNGQANTVVTAMLLIAAAGVCAERWTLVSCCIAIATLFKVYPLAFGLLLVLSFPRQLLPRLTVALLIGLGIPFLVKPPEYLLSQYRQWIEVVRMDDRRHAALPVCYRDLWLLVRVFQLPFSSEAYTVIQGLGAAGAAAMCVWGKRAGMNVRQLTMLSLGLASFWMMLLGPATESSTYLILAPTMAWIVFDAWNVRHSRYEMLAIAASLVCFCGAHIGVWFPQEVRRGFIILQPTGTLLLSGVALFRAYREISDCHPNAPLLAKNQRRLAA